jgi:signal peptidase
VLWVLLISSAAAWSVNGAAVIVGGSMEPALSAGDVVVYRRGPAIAQGELIAFSSRSWPRTVVHRAVGILPDGSIRTRGDANPIDDLTPVPREAVRGRVIVVVPAGSAASAVARGADRVVDSCANRIRRR